jgi:hypothetical protein
LIEQQAVAYEQANDPISARRVRTKLNLETGTALLGIYGATRAIARNGARSIAGANGSSGAATVVEGANGRPAMQLNGPDLIRDRDQGIDQLTRENLQAPDVARQVDATNSGLRSAELFPVVDCRRMRTPEVTCC